MPERRDAGPAELSVAALFFTLRALGLTRRVSAAQARCWREAAASAGITDLEQSGAGLVGWARPLRVRLSRFDHDKIYGTRVTITGPGLSPHLTLSREGAAAAMRRVRGVRELRVGDDAAGRPGRRRGTRGSTGSLGGPRGVSRGPACRPRARPAAGASRGPRLSGGAAGQLSLAEGVGGRVSFAEDGQGRLALVAVESKSPIDERGE